MFVRTLLVTSVLLWNTSQLRAQDARLELGIGGSGGQMSEAAGYRLMGSDSGVYSFHLDGLLERKPQHRILTGLGMGLRQIEDWVIYSHLPLKDQSGMIVEDLLANLPANQAGIKWHDIIAKVDGKPIGSVEEFVTAYEAVEGNEVPLEIIHNGKLRTVKLDKQAVAKYEKVLRIGVQVHPVPDELAIHLGLEPVATEEGHSEPVGVYVSNVEDGTPAAKSGLQAGDILLKADGRWLTSRELLNNLIRESTGNEMTFDVLRAAKKRQVKIRAEDVSRKTKSITAVDFWEMPGLEVVRVANAAAAPQLKQLLEAVERLTKEVAELGEQIKREE